MRSAASKASAGCLPALRAAGCDVGAVQPHRALACARFRVGVVNNRDHRKLLVVDRTSRLHRRSEPRRGVGARQSRWRRRMARRHHPNRRARRRADVLTSSTTAGVASSSRRPWLRPQLPPIRSTRATATGSRVRVLANHYFRERRAIRQAYLRRDRERTSARSASPTATSSPTDRSGSVLARAVDRGAEVRVIVPGDERRSRRAARGPQSLYGRLLRGRRPALRVARPHPPRQDRGRRRPLVHRRVRTTSTPARCASTSRSSPPSRTRRSPAPWRTASTRTSSTRRPVSYDAWRRRPLHVRMLDSFFYRFRRLL